MFQFWITATEEKFKMFEEEKLSNERSKMRRRDTEQWEWQRAVPQEQERPQESGRWNLSGEGDTIRFPQLVVVFVEVVGEGRIGWQSKWQTSQNWTSPQNPTRALVCLPSQPPSLRWSLLLEKHPPTDCSPCYYVMASHSSVPTSANTALIVSSPHGFCWFVFAYSWILLTAISLCLSFLGAAYYYLAFCLRFRPSSRAALIGLVIVMK